MNIFRRSEPENITLKAVATIVYVVMVTLNALANILPINGKNTGEISDSYPNLFAPIGFTFAIWSVIYVLLAAFCIYQFKKVRSKKSKVSEHLLSEIIPYFIASSVLNSAWIFAWHYMQIGLSVVLISAMLLTLIPIVTLLARQEYRGKDYVFVRLPFSIYFGWITVAVIANVTTLLVAVNWNAWGLAASFWTVAVLATGALIALVVSERNRDIAYLAVIIWAYFGILAKHLASTGFDGKYESIISTLVLLMAVFMYSVYRLATRVRK